MNRQLRKRKKMSSGEVVKEAVKSMEKTAEKIRKEKGGKTRRMIERGLFTESEFKWFDGHYLNLIDPENNPLEDDPWSRQTKMNVKNRIKGALFTLQHASLGNAVFDDEEWAEIMHPIVIRDMLFYHSFRSGYLTTVLMAKALQDGLNKNLNSAMRVPFVAKVTVTLEPIPEKETEVTEMANRFDAIVQDLVSKSKVDPIQVQMNDTLNEANIIGMKYSRKKELDEKGECLIR